MCFWKLFWHRCFFPSFTDIWLTYNIVYMPKCIHTDLIHIFCKTITTIPLAKPPSPHIIYFLCMLITFNIYCLSNFQLYNTVSSTITTLLYITSPEIICFISGSLYPSTKISPYTPSAVPDNHHTTLFLWVWVFSDSTYKWYHKYLPYSNFKIPSSHKGQDFLCPHGWIIFHCIQKWKLEDI